MEPVSGSVLSAWLQPGIPNISVLLPEQETMHMILLGDPETEVTLDGAPIEPLDVPAQIMRARLRVTLYPRPDRYMAATRAMFTTIEG